MNRFLLLTAILFLTAGLQAQQVSVSASQLDFGIVTETSPATLKLAVDNPSPDPVTVQAILPEDNGYTVTPASISLAPGGSDTFVVTFITVHNLYHNQELILLPDNHLGALSVDLLAQGRYSMSYYSSTENKSGAALRTALKTRLAQGYSQLSYNTARDHMFMTIDNQKTNGQGANVNTLECVYTGTQVISYSNRTDAQLQGFNTEHTFPQGFFSQNLPMRSDIHHLFPTTVSSNSERGNNPFGVVGNPNWQVGGSKSNGSRFEPRDEQKGATARAMCYFVVRYQDYAGHFAPQENILRQWHKDFPPTAVDKNRNDDVQAVQGNRNPFVDYPQLIDRMSSLVGNADLPEVEAYALPEASIDFDTITKPTVYTFPLVNTGNVPLRIEAPAFTDNRLAETSGTTFPYTLQPGEDLPLTVTISTVDDPGLNADMTIQITGGDLITVPVTAFWTLEAGIGNTWPTGWLIRPTTIGYVVEFDRDLPHHWRLTNLQGQLLLEGASQGQRLSVEMSALAAGTYLLGIQQQDSWTFRRLKW